MKCTPKPNAKPLVALVRALIELPAPRDTTPHERARLKKLYEAWHAATPERSRQRYWFQAKAYRQGRLSDNKASPLVKTLHCYEQHRIHEETLKRRASGFDKRREEKRKASDPDAYRAACAARQRAKRARDKEARRAAAELEATIQGLQEPSFEPPSESEWRRHDALEGIDDDIAEAAE